MATLSAVEPRTLDELHAAVQSHPAAPSDYSVAVEALIFDSDGRWLLLERGAGAQDEHGKLEGIGGRVERGDDLRAELLREIREELGDDARVDIVSFLELKSDVVDAKSDGQSVKRTWVIASFLCRWAGGELRLMEPDKNSGFVFVDSLQVDPSRLSSSGQQSLRALAALGDELGRLVTH